MLRDETISKLPDTNVNNKILLTATKFCKTRNETLSTKETDFFTNYITKFPIETCSRLSEWSV